MKKVYLIGNPNVGKTTLFNTLSGNNEETGNYAGTTLGAKHCMLSNDIELIDIPGMYGGKRPKEEERVSWNIIHQSMEEEGDILYIQVIDPDLWEQSLSLALELKKKGIPLILFVNYKKNPPSKEWIKAIEEHLCCGVFIGNASSHSLKKSFWKDLEEAQKEKNNQACMLNEFDLLAKVKGSMPNVEISKTREEKKSIDNILLHPIFGMIFFGVLMWGLFQIVFTIGAIPMDWIDQLFSFLITAGKDFFGDSFFSLLIFDGILAGVGATVIFLPNIILLFMGLSLLKETGYLARSSYLLNGIFKKIGLSGRVSVPLLMGFGCNVPAVMAISTLESKREKIAIAMMSLFMSCGARLPVYTLLIGAFIPMEWQGFLLFIIYVFGVVVAFFTGHIVSKIYPEKSSPLMLQMPSYLMPSWKKVISFAVAQGKDFFMRVWKFIVPVSVILWGLFTFPQQAITENGIEASYGASISKTIQPIFAPIGFDWTMTAGVIAGIAAKEVMVANFAQIYERENDETLGEYLKTLPQFSLPAVLALLVFTLLYMPCVAVIATIKAQLGIKWAIIGSVYPTVIAWIFGFFTYQISSFFL